MSFSDKAKLTALAIVHVFETSKAFGDYSSVTVLNDGAGVSYGINQFTHRSGSLLAVVNTYLGIGGTTGAKVLSAAMNVLERTDSAAIHQLANDRQFKDSLRFAGETDEMRLAQNEIAEHFYLEPAISACEGSSFVLPLSLAVIYDSINHGSYERIRDTVTADDRNEKAWITKYVQQRDAWLRSVPRLAVTRYRTRFFLNEIADGNWNLDLPLIAHGVKITDEMIRADEPVSIEDQHSAAADPLLLPAEVASSSNVPESAANPAETQPPVQNAENITNVQTGDKTVPDYFVPEKKTVDAPAKEGTTAASAKLTIGGFAVPTFLVGIVAAIRSAIDSGFVSADQIGKVVIDFVSSNSKYAFAGIGLVIGGMFLKKLYKQVTLWLSMYIAARADMHDVQVKPQ